MTSHVDLHVRLAKDLLAAHHAGHRSLLAVDGTLVHAQHAVEGKLLIASVTRIILLLHVLLHVAKHTQLRGKLLPALATSERLRWHVGLDVLLCQGFRVEGLGAVGAEETSLFFAAGGDLARDDFWTTFGFGTRVGGGWLADGGRCTAGWHG